MIRFARQVLFLHPDDCIPPHGLALTVGSRDSLKVERLMIAFMREGFDPKEPALVGYPDGSGKVQLLSGTHRHEAAKRADIYLWFRLRAQRAHSRKVLLSWQGVLFGTRVGGHHCPWCYEQLEVLKRDRTVQAPSGETFIEHDCFLGHACLRCQVVWPFLKWERGTGKHVNDWNPHHYEEIR